MIYIYSPKIKVERENGEVLLYLDHGKDGMDVSGLRMASDGKVNLIIIVKFIDLFRLYLFRNQRMIPRIH